MSTVCGRPQGGGGSGPRGHMWTGGGGQKRDFSVDVINGWPQGQKQRKTRVEMLIPGFL